MVTDWPEAAAPSTSSMKWHELWVAQAYCPKAHVAAARDAASLAACTADAVVPLNTLQTRFAKAGLYGASNGEGSGRMPAGEAAQDRAGMEDLRPCPAEMLCSKSGWLDP